MSTATELIDRGRFEIKLGDYGVAQANSLSDVTILPRVPRHLRDGWPTTDCT